MSTKTINARDGTDMEKKAGIAAGLAERLKDKKTARILVAAGIAGMLLIMLSGICGGSSEKARPTGAAPVNKDEEYRATIESRLTDMVRSISGDPNATVLVTLETGIQYIYANETKQNIDRTEDNQGGSRTKTTEKDLSEQKLIIIDGTAGEQALLMTEVAPAIKGVVVACAGGNSEYTQSAVISAVTTALDITDKRVCVTTSQ